MLSSADRIAVVDVETTGLFPWRHDRVIEIAILLISPDGRIHAEYETLVNPVRDIGPTRIHQISAAEVLNAPKFEDIAGDVLELLSEAVVLAGHNISFDRNFLVNEYQRVGIEFPEAPELCTYQLLGRTDLSACCGEYEIPFDGLHHRAMVDARATARLIHALLEGNPGVLDAIGHFRTPWPRATPRRTPPVTRDHAREALSGPPRFLQRILSRVQRETEAVPANVLTYQGLIDRVLEDRTVDKEEEMVLVGAVAELGLTATQVHHVHAAYIQALAVHALSDGRVSEAERSDLHDVARLLGHDDSDLDEVLDLAARQVQHLSSVGSQEPTEHELVGLSVCFTGELLSTIDGAPISREMAQLLAERRGLKVASGVTKKLDILVVADPNTQSGKAVKARRYGTRILAEPVFWSGIGVIVD